MKRSINKIILAIPVISGAMFLGCNSSNDKTSSSTITDTTITAKTDQTSTTGTDTSKMTSTTTSKKKGKVSTMMMAASEKATAAIGNSNMDAQGYYNSVEVLPTYPGGQAALDKFINDNVTYPDKAIDNNKEGTVIVGFGIDENGKVTNAKVTSPVVGDGLEEEALKVINKMPTWTPGMVKGKKVKSHYALPIRFQLAE